MQDIVFVAAMALLAVVTGLFVAACNLVMGSDEEALAEGDRESRSRPEPTESRGAT